MKSAPLLLRRWWWSKFWVSLIPLLFFGELLVIVTNHFLQVSPFMALLAPITLFFLSFAIVALGMALGIAYPNFTAEHSAKIAASFGGVLYMVLSISFIGIVVVLEAQAVRLLTLQELRFLTLSTVDWQAMGVAFALALTLSVAVFWWSARWSITRLEAMEISL